MSGVSVSTIKRTEASEGLPNITEPNAAAIERVLGEAGIEFIGSPDDGPGIRLWNPNRH